MHESLGAFWPRELRLIRTTINFFFFFLPFWNYWEQLSGGNVAGVLLGTCCNFYDSGFVSLPTTHFVQHLVPLALTRRMVTYTSYVANDSASLCLTGEEIMKMPALPGGLADWSTVMHDPFHGALQNGWKFFVLFLFFNNYGCHSSGCWTVICESDVHATCLSKGWP